MSVTQISAAQIFEPFMVKGVFIPSEKSFSLQINGLNYKVSITGKPRGFWDAELSEQPVTENRRQSSRPGNQDPESTGALISGILNIHNHAANGNNVALKKLLDYVDKSNVDLKDKNGQTPLMYAVYQGHTESVKLLLNSGADVNLTDRESQTPLHMVVLGGNPSSESLTQTAADPGLTDRKLMTPSSSPVKSHNQILELLLKSGAGVNDQDADGTTPLTYAAYYGDTQAIGLLLKYGADINLAGCANKLTPVLIAVMRGNTESAKLLLIRKAKVNIPDLDSCTPLSAAADGGRPDLIEMLLNYGADVNIPDKSKLTALMRFIIYTGRNKFCDKPAPNRNDKAAAASRS